MGGKDGDGQAGNDEGSLTGHGRAAELALVEVLSCLAHVRPVLLL